MDLSCATFTPSICWTFLLYSLLLSRCSKIPAYWSKSAPPCPVHPTPWNQKIPGWTKSGVCDLTHYPTLCSRLCCWEDGTQDSGFRVIFFIKSNMTVMSEMCRISVRICTVAEKYVSHGQKCLEYLLTHCILQHSFGSLYVAHCIWEPDSKLKVQEEFSSNYLPCRPWLYLVDVC